MNSRALKALLLGAASTLAGACDVELSDLRQGGRKDSTSTEPAIGLVAASPTPCAGTTPGVKRALFGDLHVHTTYSLDALIGMTTQRPEEAYAFAKKQLTYDFYGKPKQIDRPLDFMAVTDHANFFDVLQVKTASSAQEAKVPIWDRTRKAADEANDPCKFTALQGYEWTSSFDKTGHLHRNIIFANQGMSTVVDVNKYATPQLLWEQLEKGCVAANGCEVLAIPHNPNLSKGSSFDLEADSNQQHKLRAKYERVVEMFQTKGNSECYVMNGDDSDPECAFEYWTPEGTEEQKARSFARWALQRGLQVYDQTMGTPDQVNPLQFGMIGSTDTHSATPGATKEDEFDGSGGFVQGTAQRRMAIAKISADVESSGSTGGLAGVWAEENTRAAIFGALKRREVFATSGSRVSIRLFQTWDQSADPCAAGFKAIDTVMGGEMTPRQAKPRFVIEAKMDELEVPLARIDIIRSVVQVDGEVKQTIVSLDSKSAAGDAVMCKVWTDADYVPSQVSFWYARVLEVPKKRWSKHDCEELGVCDAVPNVDLMIQDRAWSSPIWNQP